MATLEQPCSGIAHSTHSVSANLQGIQLSLTNLLSKAEDIDARVIALEQPCLEMAQRREYFKSYPLLTDGQPTWADVVTKNVSKDDALNSLELVGNTNDDLPTTMELDQWTQVDATTVTGMIHGDPKYEDGKVV